MQGRKLHTNIGLAEWSFAMFLFKKHYRTVRLGTSEIPGGGGGGGGGGGL